MQKGTILMNFCNPKILGLEHHKFQDSGSQDCNP